MLGFGVRERTTTTGTGNLSLTAEAGYPRISQAFAVGEALVYSILDTNMRPIEHGRGYLSDTNTLVRDRPYAIYDGTSYMTMPSTPANLGAGDKIVICSSVYTFPVNFGLEDTGYLIPGIATMLAVANGTTAQSDRLLLRPFTVPYPMVVTEAAIRVVTAAAASAYVGIYSARSGGLRPNAKLSGTAAIDVSTTGSKTASLSPSIALLPGRSYYLALLPVGGSPVLAACSNQSQSLLFGVGLVNNFNNCYYLTNQSALPNTIVNENIGDTGLLTMPAVYLGFTL